MIMKMKFVCVLGIAFLASFSVKAQEQIQWMKFEEAIAANASNPKMLIIDVYTDWCGWCKKMDKETFTDPKVISHINANFYAVKLNAENTQRSFEFMGKTYTEAQMAAAMQVRSYPNFVVIEPKLQNIAQLPGYRQPEEFLTGLNDLINKAFKAKP
jgi:thioredoxin-related protein